MGADMDKYESQDLHGYRSMRWYDWLACLLLLFLAAGARGATIYRCDDAHGNTAFQDQACSAGQQTRVVTVASAPVYASSTKYAATADDQSRSGNSTSGKRGVPRKEAGSHSRAAATPAVHSYECRSSDGQVFYRHTACPHTVEAKDDHFGTGRGAQKKVEVHSVRVSREEACMQMQRAGSRGRSGHVNDEVASSYEKNLGHDPCH